jgi:hypothetical protein
MKEIRIPEIKIKTKWLWVAGGLLILVPLLLVLVLGLFGPTFGNAYSLRTESLGGGAGGYYYPGAPAYDYAAAPSAGFYAEEPAFAAQATQVAPSSTVTNGTLTQTTERLIIREGSIAMEVEDTIATRFRINALVDEFAGQGAFVVSANEYGNGTTNPSISMVIRVPADEFFAVMDRLAEMAVEVNSRVETADDVTEEYVDLAGRLEALEVGRDRLLDIMQNADTTEALLQAEAQLTIREAEIEAIQGRMQYLRGAATLSRISISLEPYRVSQPIDTRWKPLETLRYAFDNLLDSLRDFADFLIFFVVAWLPWLLAFYLIGRWVVGIVRRRRASKAAAESKK